MLPFAVLPAVDVAEGKLARAPQTSSTLSVGEYVEQLLSQGAPWVHVADLDAARGMGNNEHILTQVVRRSSVPVQWSGGVRTAEQVHRALQAGAERVNLAADLLASPEVLGPLVHRWPRQVSVAVDVADGQVVPRATGQGPVAPLGPALQWLVSAGCTQIVITEVSADGALTGVNLELLRWVCQHAPGVKVFASGGVASVQDLKQLRTLVPVGVRGVVLGTALLAGRFTLPEALTAVSEHF